VLVGEISDLTAVVTMSDDGGSSGRLRRSMGVPPPGDVRNCLVALAEEEDLLAGLFQHRYGRSRELGGHSVGNLILAALAEKSGCFLKAVELSSRVLRTVGRILPATRADVRLQATLEDGGTVVGETAINALDRPIRKISLLPPDVEPAPGVVEAIRDADLVVLGPGSLHTSILPNIAIDGVVRALRETGAAIVLVANLVSERGEAAGLDLGDHVAIIHEHAGGPVLDAVLVHDGPMRDDVLARYRAEGVQPLTWHGPVDGVPRVVQRNLISNGPKLRHDPEATVAGLIDLWASMASARPIGETV